METENLRAFARLYGLVRFFHPSDQAAELDWEAMAVHGIEEVLQARDAPDLVERLSSLLRPVAPGLEVWPVRVCAPSAHVEVRDGDLVTAWEHRGIELRPVENSPWRSRRVHRTAGPELEHRVFETALGREITCRVQLVLPVEDDDTRSPSWKDRPVVDDQATRLAAVVITWNVLRHFFPWFEETEVDWDAALDDALEGAMAARDVESLVATLRKMLAPLRDAHALVWYRDGEKLSYTSPNSSLGRPRVRFSRVEDRVVVLAAAAESGLERGDVVRRLDGEPVEAALVALMKTISGSARVGMWRALNYLGTGPMAAALSLEFVREGRRMRVAVPRSDPHPSLFSRGAEPFRYEALRHLPGGIFHVSTSQLARDEFERVLPELAAAAGVILDSRCRGGGGVTEFDFLPHLMSEPAASPPLLVPVYRLPEQREVEFSRETWELPPKPPRFRGRTVMLIDPSWVSAGETILGLVEAYDLATLVGQPTAGCNGVANRLDLPLGLTVQWTGMRVLKHGGSPLHLVGFHPDVVVEPTLAGVREGRDEVLEAAIAVLRES